MKKMEKKIKIKENKNETKSTFCDLDIILAVFGVISFKTT